jgi:hypothetical protein
VSWGGIKEVDQGIGGVLPRDELICSKLIYNSPPLAFLLTVVDVDLEGVNILFPVFVRG